MQRSDEDLSLCTALVVDGNPTMRSIVMSQLRDLGMGTVAQASRATDARKMLEYRPYDFVLCELHFQSESYSGQDLLDDLRRNQMLPFATVFILITGEATYSKVAEAAESALDGLLLKPHKANHLAKRLYQARTRKNSLKEIFSAIEAGQFANAAKLCLDRFDAKGEYWLYAARLGAELLLRVGQSADAQRLYKAVVESKTLPWAKLGVARAQLDGGQTSQAVSTLENLISADPAYVDAYDVMGRAQFEMGKFDQALETYAMAAKLTPQSIGRLQNLAMMTYYAGDGVEAEKLLDRTARMGLESKLFDSQVLVLLALTRLESGDAKGLQRCQDDFARLIEKDADNPRLQRLSGIVMALNLIQKHQFSQSVDTVRAMAKTVTATDFDFESASNLVALLSQLTNKAIHLDEVELVVETIGMRFCSNRSLTELLCVNARAHPPYAERMKTSQSKVLQYAETAMALSMGGNPTAAVKNLVIHGKQTLNSRLIDNAYQVLQKHTAKIEGAPELAAEVQALRERYGLSNAKPSLGDQKRKEGGLSLDAFTKSNQRPQPA
jgi:CheY-like chemotaxis protein/cytochrome c-type biogenesis protein CcmH/NrfG